jgi:hypothetical protein
VKFKATKLIVYNKLTELSQTKPVPAAALPKMRMIMDRLNTGIVGSNPARGMGIQKFPDWVDNENIRLQK